MARLVRPNTAPVPQLDHSLTDNNFGVCVRVRPTSAREKKGPWRNICVVLDDHVLCFDPKQSQQAEKQRGIPSLQKRNKDQRFAFDRVFDASASQLEVYSGTVKSLVDGVMTGLNATCFAYGATGAGKTYTMMGTEHSPGIMIETLRDMFHRMKSKELEYKYEVVVTYLEVYNEMIKDLLPYGPKALPAGTTLDIRQDALKGVAVAGITEHHPQTAEDVEDLIRRGNMNRTQSATDANATSSRSHAVLQVAVHQSNRTADISETVSVGKLSLVDLAGSERAAETKNRGDRMVEGANINRSLLALGNCINALVDQGKTKRKIHIPYRDSKLTRLLQDSLGGNCRTVMITNISPSSMCLEDTHNSLKYANRAKNIKTKVTRNVVKVDWHLAQYKQIIKELRAENETLKAQIKGGGASAVTQDFGSSSDGASMSMSIDDSTTFHQPQHQANELQLQMVDEFRAEIKCHFSERRQLLDGKLSCASQKARLENSVAACRSRGSDTPAQRQRLRSSEKELQEARRSYDKAVALWEKGVDELRDLEEEIEMRVQSSWMRKALLDDIRACSAELTVTELQAAARRNADRVQIEDARMQSLEGQLEHKDQMLKHTCHILAENGLLTQDIRDEVGHGPVSTPFSERQRRDVAPDAKGKRRRFPNSTAAMSKARRTYMSAATSSVNRSSSDVSDSDASEAESSKPSTKLPPLFVRRGRGPNARRTSISSDHTPPRVQQSGSNINSGAPDGTNTPPRSTNALLSPAPKPHVLRETEGRRIVRANRTRNTNVGQAYRETRASVLKRQAALNRPSTAMGVETGSGPARRSSVHTSMPARPQTAQARASQSTRSRGAPKSRPSSADTSQSQSGGASGRTSRQTTVPQPFSFATRGRVTRSRSQMGHHKDLKEPDKSKSPVHIKRKRRESDESTSSVDQSRPRTLLRHSDLAKSQEKFNELSKLHSALKEKENQPSPSKRARVGAAPRDTELPPIRRSWR